MSKKKGRTQIRVRPSLRPGSELIGPVSCQLPITFYHENELCSGTIIQPMLTFWTQKSCGFMAGRMRPQFSNARGSVDLTAPVVLFAAGSPTNDSNWLFPLGPTLVLSSHAFIQSHG
jgi:hypothetical protein